MEFKLTLDIPSSNFNLNHKNSFVLMGSCFSDEMAAHLNLAGFHVDSNAFGTLFHPIAITNVLNACLRQDSQVHSYQKDDLFFSWDSAGKITSNDHDDLLEKVLLRRRELLLNLKSATLLVITFGTSYAYRHNDLDLIVGNCHKAPPSIFTRELSSTQEMTSAWTETLELLKELNPKLQVVFTVSPVRHIKGGLVDNNRSKARLIELAHSLCDSKNSVYFPSNELLIDELRDYRFYAKDMIHPSDEAVKYIWELFSKFIFDKNTLNLIEQVEKLRTEMNHKPLHPDSKGEIERQRILDQKCQFFLKAHPEIKW